MVKVDFDPLSVPKASKKEQNSNQNENKEQTISDNLQVQDSINIDTNSTKIVNINTNLEFLHKFYGDKEFIRENAELLPCENIVIYEKASFRNDDLYSLGVLILTKYRLIFKFQDANQLNKLKLHDDYFKIQLFKIAKITKSPDKVRNEKYYIDLILKDSRTIRFFIWTKENLKFFGDLNELVFPRDPTELFLFSFDYLKYTFGREEFINGWEIYDARKEFKRQGLEEENKYHLRFSQVNEEYTLCDSYPEIIVVPTKTNDLQLKNFAMFRVNRRIPVLVYLYSKKGMSSTLWISSRYKPEGNINDGDNKLIQDIVSINHGLCIFDIKASGFTLFKGTGKYENYSDTEMFTCEFDSIQNLKKCLDNIYSYGQGNQMYFILYNI